MEAEDTTIVQVALQKPSISIADSIDLRILINLLYMMTEILRNFARTGGQEIQRAAVSLADELAGDMDTEECPPFACTLFDLVLKFCAGSSPHFPIKKILLLLWKVILTTLGGFKDLNLLMKVRMSPHQPIFRHLFVLSSSSLI